MKVVALSCYVFLFAAAKLCLKRHGLVDILRSPIHTIAEYLFCLQSDQTGVFTMILESSMSVAQSLDPIHSLEL